MERLDACYFCGTAADAPLREVSITHRAREGDPEAGISVTLCADCEGKLENVLGHVFEHVESRRADDAEAAPTGREPSTEEPSDPSTARERVDRIDVTTEDAGDGRRRLYDDIPDIHEMSPPVPDDGDDEATAGEEDAEVLEDEQPTVRARATSGDPLDGVSVAEYNRVMRLLQNRDFPMARTAFVDLASSAYDLGEDTVEQVLDAVIDQGGLEDRGGDLVRPGEGGGQGP